MVYCGAHPGLTTWNQISRRALVTDERVELASLRALDPQTVAAIHDRYFPELHRYARYRTGEDQASEDIAAETLVRLLEAVSRGRGPKTSLRGWLLGTADHLVKEHFRRSLGRPQVSLSDELIAHTGDPAGSAERRATTRSLQEALQHLTPEQQHVLALRFGGDFSLEETASAMGKKANAIKALQFRALAALRRSLQEAA